MSKPYEITKAFAQLGPNMALLAHLYRNHPQEYIRKRLKTIQLLWEGKTREEVVAFLHIDRTTIISWLKILIEHGVDTGLRLLATKKPVKKTGKLTQEQQETLIRILTTESPSMYGYDQNIFTGQILVEIVQEKWHLTVSDQTIYTILHRHKLSYQRGHRDYENADPAVQKTYAETVKKKLEMPEVTEKIVFFDEFSLTDRPSIFYGWAPVNTKFQVPSDERKKRARLNGLLAVDAINGKEYIHLSKEAKTEDIVDYFYHLSIDVKDEGYDLLTVFIDNNSTHKDKMRYNLWLKMRSNPDLQDFRVIFINTPSYSPDFNLAEYIIHQLRLKLLHHLPAKTTLNDIADKIRTFLKKGQLQTQEQVRNTINHILKLGGVECGI